VVNVPAGGDVVGAVAQVDNAGGGTVNLAAGVYNINSSIIIGSNVTLNGQGSSTVIYNPPTPNGIAMIAAPIGAVSNIIIENLVLDGNVSKAAFGESGEYANSGIYVTDSNSPASNILVKNVEIRNFGDIGILMQGANSITFNNIYVHDNNFGNFAHNIYLVGCSFVYFTHSRSSHALTGDGLHFDFNAAYYLISKSEFSNNHGEGILDQGATAIYIQDSVLNFNVNDGLNASSNGELLTRSIANENEGQGFNIQGSEASFDLVDIPNGGFDYFSQAGAFGNFIAGTTPNQYLAILANGVTGATDTADWVTDLSTQQAGGYLGGPALSGYSSIGVVDFNSRHLSDGLLTFPSVGVVGAGPYSTTWAYSNGSGSTVTMALTINGAGAGTISFPPTANWSTWGTVPVTMNLQDGGNVVSVSPQGGAAPLLDYMQVNTAIPSHPATPTGVAASALSPYSVQITWNTVPGASTYTIVRSGVTIAVGVTGTSYTDSDILQGSSQYSYQVVAINQGGNSSPSAAFQITTPVDAPTGLQVTATANNDALSWLSSNGAVSYNVLRSYTSGGPYTVIATVAQTSYTDLTATPQINAYYVVEAVNAAGTASGNSYELGVLTQLPVFQLTMAQPSLTLILGTGGSIGVSVTDGGNFSGAVSFTATGLPAGATASFSPTSSATGTTLSLFIPATVASGSYTITVTATPGNVTHSTTFTLIIPPAQTITFNAISSQPVGTTLPVTATSSAGLTVSIASSTPTVCTVTGSSASLLAAGTCTLVASQAGNATNSAAVPVTQSFSVVVQGFTLSAGTAVLTQAQNSVATESITVTPLNGFLGTVTYALSGLPNGVTSSVSGNTLTLSVAAAAAGQYSVTVTGTSGTHTATTYFTLVISAPVPRSQTISFSPIENGTVGSSLSLGATASSGLPVTYASSTPTVCTVMGTSVSLLAAGTCSIVASQSGDASYAAAAAVTKVFSVVAQAFTLTAATTVLTQADDSTITDLLSVTAINGFSGTVAYSISGLPQGVTSSFSGNTLQLIVSATAAPGTYPLTVTGRSGSLSEQLTITLDVTSEPAPVSGQLPPVTVSGSMSATKTKVDVWTGRRGGGAMDLWSLGGLLALATVGAGVRRSRSPR